MAAAATPSPQAYVFAPQDHFGERYAVLPACAKNTQSFAEARLGKGNVILLADSSQLTKLPKRGAGNALCIPGGSLMQVIHCMEKYKDVVKEFAGSGGGVYGSGSGGSILGQRMIYKMQHEKGEKATETTLEDTGFMGIAPVESHFPITDLCSTFCEEGAPDQEVVVVDEGGERFHSYFCECSALKVLDEGAAKVTSSFLTHNKPYPIASACGTYREGRFAVTQFLPEIDPHVGATPRKMESAEAKAKPKTALKTTEVDRLANQKAFNRMLDFVLKV